MVSWIDESELGGGERGRARESEGEIELEILTKTPIIRRQSHGPVSNPVGLRGWFTGRRLTTVNSGRNDITN